jgi:hypothetical protein
MTGREKLWSGKYTPYKRKKRPVNAASGKKGIFQYDKQKKTA